MFLRGKHNKNYALSSIVSIKNWSNIYSDSYSLDPTEYWLLQMRNTNKRNKTLLKVNKHGAYRLKSR